MLYKMYKLVQSESGRDGSAPSQQCSFVHVPRSGSWMSSQQPMTTSEAEQAMAELDQELNRLQRSIRLAIQAQLAKLTGRSLGNLEQNQDACRIDPSIARQPRPAGAMQRMWTPLDLAGLATRWVGQRSFCFRPHHRRTADISRWTWNRAADSAGGQTASQETDQACGGLAKGSQEHHENPPTPRPGDLDQMRGQRDLERQPLP